MVDARAALFAFLEEFIDGPCVAADGDDLFDCFGIAGDDGFEFIEAFAKRFEVDLDPYRWYFHHGEEGWGLGGLIFAPPNRRVKPIAITPTILLEAIRTRKWPIDYPAHRLPRVRWDVRLNLLLAVLPLLLLGLVWLLQRVT